MGVGEGVGGYCSLTFTSFSDLSTCPNKGFSKNKDSKGWLEKSPRQSQGCHPGITSLTISSEIMTPSLVLVSVVLITAISKRFFFQASPKADGLRTGAGG